MTHNQHITTSYKRTQLDLLLSAIQAQLKWGASEDWTGTDFEKLSDLIFEKSQQRLSVTTLKRVWGRTSQTVKPSNTTLDILSQYAGATNWRAFLNRHQEPIGGKNPQYADSLIKRKLLLVIGASILGLMTLFMAFKWVSSNKNGTTVHKTGDVKLDIRKVTNGIPNTVVFRYDIGSTSADTIELQQSWDERKRVQLDPSDSLVTATYFTPGYFNAKLVADGQIIERQDLYLPSDGLEVMVFLKDNEMPRLLSKDHWSITSEEFQFGSSFKNSFDGQKKESILIVNLLEEPEIAAESFDFITSFRLSADDEGSPCHPISIIITGSEDVYMFEIGNTGCSGEFTSYLGGDFENGKNRDFSAMGFSEDEWVDLQVSKKGTIVKIKTNGKEIVLSDSALAIGKIGGVKLYINQDIKFRSLEIKDENQMIDLLNKEPTKGTE